VGLFLTLGMSGRGEHYALTVKHGEKFKIELQSNPSTGYRWHLVFFNRSILKLLSSEFAPKTANQIGTTGIQRFEFEATKEGTTIIRLIYRRPWEREIKKADEYFVNIL
jgi:inhibitor of cysteine peptidase